jgi:hypothetical protein
MQIKIVSYTASASRTVQAFVDAEIDGWIRVNGLNWMRDGTIRSAQLTPWGNGKRLFRDAVQILNDDLSKLLAADILMAISQHVAMLPPQERIKAPLTAEERPVFKQRAKQRPETTGNKTAATTGPANGAPERNSAPARSQTMTRNNPARDISRMRVTLLESVKGIPAKPSSGNAKLPPPSRLLANFPRRTP